MAGEADNGQRPDASARAGWLILAFLTLLAVPLGLFLLLAWWIDSSAAQVTGRVVEKREWIAMPGGDSWTHAYEIVFQYRPLDAPLQETASQRVDAAGYRALRVDSSGRFSPACCGS